MAATMEKIKDVLHIHNSHTSNGVPEGTAGPHSSRVANAADPRIDSDLDSSRRTGAVGTTNGHSGTGIGHNGYNTTSGGVPEGTAGPHSSRIANAADPRVDSDLDSSRRTGAVGTTGTSHHGTAAGVTGTSGVNNTAGPHSSNLMNKLDPRVDSDRDGSRNMGASTGATGASAYTGNQTSNSAYSGTGTGVGHTGHHNGHHTGHHTGTTGGISNSTNAGPHDSNLANKLDPRVDSDLDGRGNRTGAAGFGAGSHATPGQGTAQNTAGPHNNDMANKLDPRVDADLDGSRTLGGNRTYQ